MRRRLLILLAVTLTALAVVGAVRWWMRPRPHIDEEHAALIKRGMTLGQVEKLLGGPPGDYTVYAVPIVHLRGPGPGEPPLCWSSDRGQICVELDEQGAVAQAWFEMGVAFRRRSSVERVRELFR